VGIDANIPTRTVPALFEILSGRVSLSNLRKVEIQDLLRREPVRTDLGPVRRIVSGLPVLLTGAGGSIGSELARQLAQLAPSNLVLLGNGENEIFDILNELRATHPSLRLTPVIADVRDLPRIRSVFRRFRPHAVFHAAAHKHVPLLETNPREAVLNNIVGTRDLVATADRHGVNKFVLISTDKAVNPTSVMGATKRLAESFGQALDLYEARRDSPYGHGTRYVTVRFGNVLGSTGSVVPLFARQLATGGPLTVTDPEADRFFMTVREAVELVLQATALSPAPGTADARGKIFVLDMGEPVKIVDLAHQMIRLAGLRLERDIKIEFIGLRPGEKLHEELFHPAEALVPTANPAIRLAAPRTADYAMLARAIDELEDNARSRREERVLQLLERLVPEYRRATPGPRAAAASGG